MPYEPATAMELLKMFKNWAVIGGMGPDVEAEGRGSDIGLPSVEETESARQGNQGAITKSNDSKLFIYKPLQCQLYRVFNNGSFSEGGRFYGAEYQGFPGSKRKTIRINGRSIVEADYSAYHARMLYHLNGIDYKGDPYNLFNRNTFLRKAVKLLLNIAINAKSPVAAKISFNNHLNKGAKDNLSKDSYKRIKKEMMMRGLSVKKLYDTILHTHTDIGKFIGSGYGIKLQCIDSEIASDILMHFTDKKIPCLCIHDSFIVPQQYKEELVEMMKESYRNKFKFDPAIEIK